MNEIQLNTINNDVPNCEIEFNDMNPDRLSKMIHFHPNLKLDIAEPLILYNEFVVAKENYWMIANRIKFMNWQDEEDMSVLLAFGPVKRNVENRYNVIRIRKVVKVLVAELVDMSNPNIEIVLACHICKELPKLVAHEKLDYEMMKIMS
jgi:S-adenosylmethionine synthetase